ncbi:MAG: hypothetical protein M3O28_12005, partial [Actinomycetota bacterium]|nr:hypothetical protein [Actinomycetota bacterium]
MATSPDAAAGPAPAMSLTEWLRERTDDQLAEILRLRPDLALPAPADLAMLASRLSVRTSVQRAVDSLNAFTLRLLEGLVIAGVAETPVAVSAAAQLLGDVDEEHVATALDRLLALGLVWGPADSLRLVPTVRETVGTYPAGLGRPAADLLRYVSDLQLAAV